MQLLRALQERRIRPVGSNREVAVDIRLVAATNEDLEAAIARGTFRADLYHRINEFTLRMPEVRQMREDIMLYADFFLDQANRQLDKHIVGFDGEAAAAMVRYDWPGNLRQMKNMTVDFVEAPLASSTHDMALVTTLEKAEDVAVYAKHPEHVKVADTYVRPYTTERAALDYEE